MRHLMLLIVFFLLATHANAQGPEDDAPMPREWVDATGIPMKGLDNQLRLVIDDQKFNSYGENLVYDIRKWMMDSAAKTKNQRAEIDKLKQQLAELQRAVAKLQPQQPGGTKPGTDESRLAALEDRVAKLEAEKAELKAPLTVQGAGGKTILRLSADGYLLLGADGGNQIALIAQPGAAARIAVQGGNAAAQLSAGNGEAKVEAFNGPTQRVELRASGSELGLVVEKNGQPAAGLGSTAGKGVALRIYDKSGKAIAAAGENPRTPGTGLIYVGNGSKNGAALAANTDGSGVVHAFATDGTVGAGLIGVERLVGAYNASGAAVATMSKSEGSEGGNVTTRNPAGEGVFRAGYRSDLGGGEACVYRAKRENTFCIGITAR